MGIHCAVGKFHCTICQTHFSRSDLLSRHRKVHENNAARIEARRPEPSSITSHEQHRLPRPVVSHASEDIPLLGQLESSLGHRHITSEYPTPQNGKTSMQALEPYNQIQNDQPASLPYAHATSGENLSFDLAAYDGDIAWTLDFAQDHPSVGLDSSDTFQAWSEDVPRVNCPQIQDIQSCTLQVNEEDAGEWPDQTSRPTSPGRENVPRSLHIPKYWLSIEEEAQAAKIQLEWQGKRLQGGDLQEQTRKELINLLDISAIKEGQEAEIDENAFPSLNVLSFFLHLYFQHVHQRLPVIHLATFDAARAPPILLMAMLLLGSSHVRTNRGWFERLFYPRCRIAFMHKYEAQTKIVKHPRNILS